MKCFLLMVFLIYHSSIFKLSRQSKNAPLSRKLLKGSYIMTPMDRKEQLMYLLGKPKKGNRVKLMKGGLLNLELGTEGAPIYIDQSPSYLYSNPKSVFNQNGVRLPFTQQNDPYRSNQNKILESNFIKPANYDNRQKVYLPSIFNEHHVSPRNLRNIKVRTIAEKSDDRINIATPQGDIIETRLQDVAPDDIQYYTEGAQQMSDLAHNTQIFNDIHNLVEKVNWELNDFKTQMAANDDQVENLMNRIYNLKIT